MESNKNTEVLIESPEKMAELKKKLLCKPGKMGLVIGGGSPNYTLMTGALLAFDEAGVKFHFMSAAGGGGLVALLYLVPKNLSRQDSLKNSVNIGVSDEIYRFLPINYKVFQKGTGIADLFRKALTYLPRYEKIVNQYKMSDRQKFYSDLIQLVWSIVTPTTLNLFSSGLCAHAPWVNELVDFDRVKDLKEDLYLNAYSLNDQKLVLFDKTEIDFRHFGASLSYPFFYPPTTINGRQYIEGASQDPYNFKVLLEKDPDINTIVLLDSFSNADYLQYPNNLFESFSQEIITPLIALSQCELELLRYQLHLWNEAHPWRTPVELIVIKFKIPGSWLPTALDWSRSNLQRNFDLGYSTGQEYLGSCLAKGKNAAYLGSERDHTGF